jgi:hypothetical protein
MGLEEIDLDLEDLMNSTEETTGDDEDISDLSKKELYALVEKKGQINLGDNRALIKCPCMDEDWLAGDKTNYMCALSMRPDPKDGKQKPVCSGPLIGVRTLGVSGKEKWESGRSVRKDCPYSPRRFQEENR